MRSPALLALALALAAPHAHAESIMTPINGLETKRIRLCYRLRG
jgi:hypothetical protein